MPVDKTAPSFSNPTMSTSDIPSFHLFPLLPSELRLKIWRRAIRQVPPRLVSITPIPGSVPENKIWDAANCAPNCQSHFRPHRESPPALLSACRDARQEGLKVYKRFAASIFESGLVDLQKDTLHHVRCHHINVEGARVGARAFVEWWDSERSVIARLAANREDVAEVVSLALCPCEMRDLAYAPNLMELVETLQKYTKLRELVFVRLGTKEFVDGLDEQPPFTCPRQRAAWMYQRTRDFKSPQFLLSCMHIETWEFRKGLERLATHVDPSWIVPSVRIVVVSHGKKVWGPELNSGL